MPQTITKPTVAQLDAAERVLAEVLGPQPLSEPDGYWRSLAEAVLEAADEVQVSHPADLLARGDASDAEIRALVTPSHGELSLLLGGRLADAIGGQR